MGKRKYDFALNKELEKLSIGEFEAVSFHRRICLFLSTEEKKKKTAKNEENINTGQMCTGGKKKKSSEKFQLNGSPLGLLACKTFPHMLKEEKKTKLKKDSH